jgi:hypothetical protein
VPYRTEAGKQAVKKGRRRQLPQKMVLKSTEIDGNREAA